MTNIKITDEEFTVVNIFEGGYIIRGKDGKEETILFKTYMKGGTLRNYENQN